MALQRNERFMYVQFLATRPLIATPDLQLHHMHPNEPQASSSGHSHHRTVPSFIVLSCIFQVSTLPIRKIQKNEVNINKQITLNDYPVPVHNGTMIDDASIDPETHGHSTIISPISLLTTTGWMHNSKVTILEDYKKLELIRDRSSHFHQHRPQIQHPAP